MYITLNIVIAFLICVKADIRIIGGTDTSIEEFPHQASIIYYGKRRNLCSGSIVGPKHILTAAHCLYDYSTAFGKRLTMVYLGSTNIADGDEYRVKDVQWVPKFQRHTLQYDVGIITLMDPIRFGPKVQKINIISEGKEPQHGEMLTVTGWGLTEYESSAPSKHLQKARFPVIDRRLCRNVYVKEDYPTDVQDNMICAGGGVGITTRGGDSGNPVINNKNQLVGVNSWGRRPDGGDSIGYPSVFANLAHPLIQSFIRNHIS